MSHKAKIHKAVICCGGKATRFAPISRTVPKEMLPIADKPVIHYIMQELIDAGITDILFLIGTDRGSLQHYTDEFTGKVNIYFRRVPIARGPADNIWHAKSFAGTDNFIIAYCDDVFFDGNPTQELIETGAPALTVFEVPKEQAHNYGIYSKGKITEKPDHVSLRAERSNPFAVVGRYLMTPQIFEYIEQEMPCELPGEICFTRQLNKIPKLYAVSTAAKRFDTGTPRGLFEANKYVFECHITKNT